MYTTPDPKNNQPEPDTSPDEKIIHDPNFGLHDFEAPVKPVKIRRTKKFGKRKFEEDK